MMNTFITGLVLSLSLCLDIGIGNVAIINVTLKYGARQGYWFGLGSIIGDLLYATLSLAGMGVLLKFAIIGWLTWLAGSAVLLWFAVKMALAAWRDAQPWVASRQAPQPARRDLIKNGLAIALASPSSIVWFAAAGGSLIAQATDGSLHAMATFLTGFFAGGIAWCIFLISITSRGQAVMGKNFIRGCHLLSAILYVYFAIIIFIDGMKKFHP